ncbi:AraC family transcriptional regulator [soil metagenome]
MSDINKSRRNVALTRQILARNPRRVAAPPVEGESFRWFEIDFPARTARLTYHPDFEVHLIRRTHGRFIIGDRSQAFGPGHIALIGANVPHGVVSLLDEGQTVQRASAVVQFGEPWISALAFAIPELAPIGTVLAESSRGVVLAGAAARRAVWEMEAIGRTRGPLRVGHLFALLSAFASAPKHEKRLVASALFATTLDPKQSAAADAGLAYILDNLSTDLTLAGAAISARMSESAFSKHFKLATGATFSDTVRSLRIAQARRLLERTDKPVAVISQEVGYHNLSNFNRQFLALTSLSPAAYRRRTRQR